MIGYLLAVIFFRTLEMLFSLLTFIVGFEKVGISPVPSTFSFW